MSFRISVLLCGKFANFTLYLYHNGWLAAADPPGASQFLSVVHREPGAFQFQVVIQACKTVKTAQKPDNKLTKVMRLKTCVDWIVRSPRKEQIVYRGRATVTITTVDSGLWVDTAAVHIHNVQAEMQATVQGKCMGEANVTCKQVRCMVCRKIMPE